jgi:hypothetical protein
MFKPYTVLVVGAGASYEVNLPIGEKIKNEIQSLCTYKFNYGEIQSGDSDFYLGLLNSPLFSKDSRRLSHALSKIANGIGYVSSVDNFLEIHSDDVDLQVAAKSAIVRIIAKSEQRSKLNFDRSNVYNRLSPAALNETWYQGLAQILFEQVRSNDLASAFSPIVFISFNYDRCIEWFLLHCLSGLYSIEKSVACKIMQGVKIYHPYGDIGDPHWSSNNFDFFAPTLPRDVSAIAERIRTFTEPSSDDEFVSLRKVVREAQTIVFLGFGFHPQNLELLGSGNRFGTSKVKNIIGTSFGMSANDRADITSRLKTFFTATDSGKYTSPQVDLVDLECKDFLKAYKRTLSK